MGIELKTCSSLISTFNLLRKRENKIFFIKYIRISAKRDITGLNQETRRFKLFFMFSQNIFYV